VIFQKVPKLFGQKQDNQEKADSSEKNIQH
jgi:hypothetical protein